MMNRSKSFAGLLVAAMTVAFSNSLAASGRLIGDMAPKPTNHKRAITRRGPSGGHKKTTLHSPNGAREYARRVRQMAAGILRASA